MVRVRSKREVPCPVCEGTGFVYTEWFAFRPPHGAQRSAQTARGRETRPEAANRARAQAQEDFLRVRGAFFRAFLLGLLEALREEEDWLFVSTRLLTDLLGEFLGVPPSWAKPMRLSDLSQSRLAEVRERLQGLLKMHKVEWKGGKPHLRLGPDARRIAGSSLAGSWKRCRGIS